jgi:hypothetical protein
LQALFAPNQLEQRYGGTAPNVNGPKFWPPIFPDKDVSVDQDKVIPLQNYEKHLQERPNLRRPPWLNPVNKQEENKDSFLKVGRS